MISIVVPVYNCSKYIEIMRNNFNQFNDARYEVIFIDDGSTDDSFELLKREFPFSKVVYQENQGSGIARNNGIELANGDYIAFSDVDDFMRKGVLDELVEQNPNVEIIQAVVKRCHYNENNKKIKERVWKPALFEVGNVNVFPSTFEKLYLDTIVMSKIFRSDFLKNSGVRFPMGKYEDKHFLYHLYKLQPKVAVVNKYLYEWNVFKNSNSQTNVKNIDDLHQRFTVGFDIIDDTTEHKNFLLANFINHDFVLYANDFDKFDEEFKKVLYSYVEKLNDYSAEKFRLTKKGKLVRAESYEEFVTNYNKIKNIDKRTPKLIAKEVVRRTFKMLLTSRAKKGHWVFSDRTNKASDNAEALYRYVKENNLKKDIYFVIEKNSKDYMRLKEDGFKLLAYGSLTHIFKQYSAEYFITSHINNEVIQPWRKYGVKLTNPKSKLIFLQHGVTRSDLSSWFNTKRISMLCTSTEEEFKRVTESGRYIVPREGVKLTGLARHDLLRKDIVSEKVLIFPTWRSFLENNEEAANYEFTKQWSSMIKELSELKHVKFSFVLHPSINVLLPYFSKLISEIENVELINYFEIESFSNLINQHAVLITDFSSISFDFLYTRKPVIYFKFEEEETHFTNSRPEYELYDSCGYLLDDKVKIKEKVQELFQSKYQLDGTKVEGIGNLFAYNDSGSCSRIYKEISNLKNK